MATGPRCGSRGRHRFDGGPNYRFSDAEAKAILLSWPTTTTKLWPPPGGAGTWVRANPRTGNPAGPRVFAPGSELFSTQSDGLWVHFNEVTSCDIVAIEVCQSVQNLTDERSRHMPSTHSLVFRVSRMWVDEVVPGGQGRSQLSRRELAATLPELSTKSVDVPILVLLVLLVLRVLRVLRVLYALKDTDYKAWVPQHVPTGYEYFIPHSSLSARSRPETQEFLKGIQWLPISTRCL